MKPSPFSGIPTAVDIEKLVARYGVPAEGEVIPFAEAAEVVGHPKESFRFKTVFAKWRKKLFLEHNVYFHAPRDGTVKASDPSQRITISAQMIKSSRKKERFAKVLSFQTDERRLNKEEQEVRRNIVDMNAGRLLLHSLLSQKQI
jgi:hypothetical protein